MPMMPRPSAYREPHQFRAAEPQRIFFDPWNSASTGHQRAENESGRSVAWRESRTKKLGEQFGSGNSGGKRLFDTAGPNRKDPLHDGRLPNGSWQRGAPGLRQDGQLSLKECLDMKKTKPVPSSNTNAKRSKVERHNRQDASREGHVGTTPQKKQIFANLNFYINGSTYPTISDHKLKHLIVEHGGRLSIALGRRTVTHVILGRPNSGQSNGAGGGLSGSKIAKEVQNVRGKSVRFISVEWVVDSIKAESRLPERNYECLRLAHRGQQSVSEMLELTEEHKG